MDVTPDGARYLTASNRRVARPFHYRWLLPRLCGDNVGRWEMVTYPFLGASCAFMFFYADGGWRGLAAAALFVGCAGVFRFNWQHPVLVDAFAMSCALASAVCFRHGLWPLGLAVALLGGCARETSPLFAALFAWNPLALLGMVAPAIRHFQREGPDCLDPENAWILTHPIKASRKYHKGLPPWYWVLPWGAALCGLSQLSWQLAAVLLVAYAQCLVATDTVRLYQWAAPVLILAAVNAVPLTWLPVLVVLHLVNPFASEGL